MSVKLTAAQSATLSACQDWRSPVEIAFHRHDHTGVIVGDTGQRAILGRLRNQGLVEYFMPNDTFRATPAGRAALAALEAKP